jgi:hypothetical protein
VLTGLSPAPWALPAAFAPPEMRWNGSVEPGDLFNRVLIWPPDLGCHHSGLYHHLRRRNVLRTGCGNSQSTCSRKMAVWVYGVGEDGLTAFTGYGIECLKQIIADQKGRRKGAAPDPVHGIAPLRGSPHADPQDRPNLVVSPDAHCDSSPTRDERPHEVPRQVDRSRRIRRSRASPGRSPR